MGVILLPNGVSATKTVEHMTREEVDLVLKFEAWTRKHGIAMDLICRKCLDDGRQGNSRLVGNNAPGALAFHMTCAHRDLIYGDAKPRL